MSRDSPAGGSGTEKWDQVFQSLSAQPRRMIIFSLMKKPERQWVPLPDAAQSSVQSIETETLCTHLRHRHLPELENAGYIRWKTDPFCVRRGPHFEEPAFIIRNINNQCDIVPKRLRDECVVIGNIRENRRE